MHETAPTPTAFVGRSQEIDEIAALLDDPACRLLTLTGPGGIGKTRLALEIAARKRNAFPDGIFYVFLAPLNRADDLLAAIAEATPFRFQQDSRDPRQQFFDYLREKQAKRLLLVLDNFEHLLDGVGIVSEILAATAGLKILVTSRESLNLEEEWVRQLAGLAYPDQTDGKPLESYSAVQLFLDRARRIRGDFDLGEDSASVVAICRLVEGMPLAIELAAGWLKLLRPADIAREIERNRDILATRSRNLPERHRSIRSVFEHSWRLLDDDERDAFRKLSVFRGGFTREAAEEVAGAALHALAGLVDKSLVRLNAAGRYDVHELLRQYGGEQLNAEDQAAVERAYSDYYLRMLHRLEPEIKARQQIAALDTIAVDFENVRNAWQLAAQQGHCAALSAAVESLHFFSDMRGRYHEVVPLLREALEHFLQVSDDEAAYCLCRIRARLVRLVLLGNLRIDFDVRTQIDACLAAASARGDQAEIGFCLLVSGIVAVWELAKEQTYDNPTATALFRQSCAVFAALDDKFYQGEALVWSASTLPVEGEYDPDNDPMWQSLALRREIGDCNGIAWITLNLTEVMLVERDYRECERYAREALALMREIGSLKGILQAMFQLAQTVTLKGDLAEARTLTEQMRDLADESNNLDGKMMAAGLLAFLVCIMDENYAAGAALAQQYHALSQEPFFGGHNDLGAQWGQAAANCGLGQYEAARCSYASLFLGTYDDPAAGSVCLALEAVARAHEGAAEAAAELLGLAFAQPAPASGWLRHWPLLARLRADLTAKLGEAAYQAAAERGAARDLEATIRLILGAADDAPRHLSNTTDVPNAAASDTLLEPLSGRELEVLSLIADGLSNREIAERLVLSVGTVKVHTRNIYGKLNVNSRTQAVAQAARFNLL